MKLRGECRLAACALLALLAASCGQEEKPALSLDEARTVATQSENQGLAAPPRTIADVLASLEAAKPDAARLAAARGAADAAPPADASPQQLYAFYLARGGAAGDLGRDAQQAADLREAVRIAESNQLDASRALQQLHIAEAVVGNTRTALDLAERFLAAAEAKNTRGTVVTAQATVATLRLWRGDLAGAREAIAAAERGLETVPPRQQKSPGFAALLPNWEAAVLRAKAEVAAATGNYEDAERHARAALAATERMLAREAEARRIAPELPPYRNAVIVARQRLGKVLLAAGRPTEAEAEYRAALAEALRQFGRDSGRTANALVGLASAIYEQGRRNEARQLADAALEILARLGRTTHSRLAATAHVFRAEALAAGGDAGATLSAWEAARAVFPDDPGERFRHVEARPGFVLAQLAAGRTAEALPLAERAARIKRQRYGDRSYEAAEARGILAMALVRAGRAQRALDEFRAAVPILLQRSQQSEIEGVDTERDRRVQQIVEAYIDLLGRGSPKLLSGIDAPAEAFRLADAVRARGVQSALAASAARASIRDPELARLVRQEQDAQKRIGAHFGLLGKILSSPADQQDKAATEALRAGIERLRDARAALREEIERRFPDYASLIDPRAASLAEAQKLLRPKEALVAIHVGAERSFVWAVPAQGRPGFAAVELGERALADIVAELRKALDPQASTLEEIPAYDVALAQRLHDALLRPVAPALADAERLLVVPDKALGQLPFALLVTEATPVEDAGGTRFSGYRRVPFLVRKAAVAQLPSVTALGTLRRLPPSDSARLPFAGFGDPWFSQAQARQAQGQVQLASATMATRGLSLARRAAPATRSAGSAQLSMLPRLPETAEEVRSIARALGAEPSRDVHLGASANEAQLKRIDLAQRKVLMFATHGLVPGDLDGLAQPALALTAPEVAGIEGDGLLTMDEILALRLDADWVVLSACNTAAAEGAGAEAISGLGRAFFYAGTRALLVTHWPVETLSARALTTDIFRRQAENPRLPRAEAVRQAMLALIDGDGFVEGGKAVFAYAHPIFWAPFAVVGDPGG